MLSPSSVGRTWLGRTAKKEQKRSSCWCQAFLRVMLNAARSSLRSWIPSLAETIEEGIDALYSRSSSALAVQSFTNGIGDRWIKQQNLRCSRLQAHSIIIVGSKSNPSSYLAPSKIQDTKLKYYFNKNGVNVWSKT